MLVDGDAPRLKSLLNAPMARANPQDTVALMVRAGDRPGFGVHLDPCNLVNSPERFYRSSDVVRECYAKLGPWIASVHVKDLTWDVEMSLHFREVQAGFGSFDHTVVLAEHARTCPGAPLMLEHLETASEYDGARDHLRRAAAKVNVTFD